MFRILAITSFAVVFAAAAHAGPIRLGAAQMDSVTAGAAVFDALSAARPPAFSVTHSNGRLDHDVADLRFQPSGDGTGIAIPGGSEANFDRSVLRESGNPSFGAVVVYQ